MFKKNDFSDDYLNFHPDFDIQVGNSVIFAPNGTGKTSIYRTIINLERSKNNVFPIDYESIKENFIKNKKKITIGPNIKQIEDIDNAIATELEKTSFSKLFKRTEISTIGKANDLFSGFGRIYKDDNELLKLFTDANIEILLPYKKYCNNFLNCYSEISSSVSLLEDIANLENFKLKELYNQLSLIIDEDCNVCPVCDTDNTTPILTLVSRKKEDLKELNGKLVETIYKENPDLNIESIKEDIDGFLKTFVDNNIDVKDLISLQFLPADDPTEVEKFVENTNAVKQRIIEYEEIRKTHIMRLETFLRTLITFLSWLKFST